MDARLQRRIQRYGWDKAAQYYEQYWQEQLAPARRLLLETADLRPRERVLDLACGTGLVTFAAAEAVGPDGTVVAADISDVMVRSVEAEAASRRLGYVTATRLDAEDLRAFPDSQFDVVLCSLGLMYVADPRRSLEEMRRVLQPGGRAVVSVWGARSCCGWAEIFPIVESRVESEVCPMFFRLGTGDSLARAMTEAGFGDVGARRLSTTLEYASGEEACGAAFAGGPVALAYSRFDDRVREEARADYLSSIDRYRTASGYAIAGEFVVARGARS
jgi:ubiquinone/menaquinone biosynthesis C-methylase UbiE